MLDVDKLVSNYTIPPYV